MKQNLALGLLFVIAAAVVWSVVRTELTRIEYERFTETISMVDDRGVRSNLEVRSKVVTELIVVEGTGIKQESVELPAGLWQASFEVDDEKHGSAYVESEDGLSSIGWSEGSTVFTVGDFGEADLYRGPMLIRVGANEGVGWTMTFERYEEPGA